jgi:hypothetical protein
MVWWLRQMLPKLSERRHMLGADKGYDTSDFVAELRQRA